MFLSCFMILIKGELLNKPFIYKSKTLKRIETDSGSGLNI